jgi:hypothetical protein
MKGKQTLRIKPLHIEPRPASRAEISLPPEMNRGECGTDALIQALEEGLADVSIQWSARAEAN